jgi:ferredoxin
MFYFVLWKDRSEYYRLYRKVSRRRPRLIGLGGWFMTRVPVLDLGECTDCDGCITVCPSLFQRNDTMGYIEMAECDECPEEEIEEAINICPRGCIQWAEE